jgi:hypothetical protein
MAKHTNGVTRGKRPHQPAWTKVDPWRFTWHEDADGETRFHCPVCASVQSRGAPRSERGWPKTSLAQETLKLATELAQSAWLVDQLGPDGNPLMKALVPDIMAVHRASRGLPDLPRDDVRFVLKSVADDWTRVTNWKRTEQGKRLDELLALACTQFLSAWTRNFGVPKHPSQVRPALESLWASWVSKRGQRGYRRPLEALWQALRGTELRMAPNGIHQLARIYRSAAASTTRTADPGDQHSVERDAIRVEHVARRAAHGAGTARHRRSSRRDHRLQG